jgi:putative PIN family toxin of toxin-antitoxin system
MHIIGNMQRAVRLVLDTNILVAASRHRDGPSHALIQAIRRGRAKVCCSATLFLEYESVLKRPEQLAVSGWSEEDVDAVRAELASLVEPIRLHYRWRPQLRDPSDEMVLEAAVNCGADALITYNLRDFLPAARFNLAVLTPPQAWSQFQLAKV